MRHNKIIFSDIDGCIIIKNKQPDFLIINQYLQRIINKGLNIVLSSAKTAHEIIKLNQSIHLPGPFIIENGTGILFKNKPQKSFSNIELLEVQDYFLLKLAKPKPSINILSTICKIDWLLTQMTDEKLCHITGIPIEDAALAKARFFTEPLYIKNLNDINLKTLKLKLRKSKLYFTQTSQFLHISSCKKNHKGYAINFLLEQFYSNEICHSFAIGDSFNDFSMFNLCNEAFFITQNVNQHYPNHWHILPKKDFLSWQLAIDQIILQADKP